MFQPYVNTSYFDFLDLNPYIYTSCGDCIYLNLHITHFALILPISCTYPCNHLQLDTQRYKQESGKRLQLSHALCPQTAKIHRCGSRTHSGG